MLAKFTRIIAVAMLFVGAFVLPAQAAPGNYSISGNITVGGLALKGVTVVIKGTKFSAVTNGLGNYSITQIPVGKAGTVVPKLANYSFTPPNFNFTALSASLTAQNFLATQIKPVVYNIAGKVLKTNGTGLAGVTVTFGSFSAVTGNNGHYVIMNIPAGTRGRLIPSRLGFGFNPGSITTVGLTGNLKKQNFVGFKVFTVSGQVTETGTGLPLGGVTVTLGAYSAVSNATTGTYTINNIPKGTSGNLIPSLAGETFTPTLLVVTNLTAALHSENFVAAP